MSLAVVAVLPPVSPFGYAVPAAALVAYGTAIGVLIDLDHFLIARLKTGGWDAVRFCLSNPAAAVADQSRIFDRGDVGVLSRLLSHLVLIGLLVALLALASVPLAVLTAAVLYVHLLTDVAWDASRLDRQIEASADDEELVQALR
ncbi:hypothetical protein CHINAEXTREME_19025 [Halobiforma lacisalsi AJ5]|uniref:Uncharacterized protein n=1 Tax=Natronobacterium lacisalsi AJ5 TaxID=358396 RepID=M0LSH3_NATLA|nr:hypothetical protein [Halobiforma lacisalsi]APW99733.1 hypothetical protein CHINAEXTREME_19025 [Halobiforma lacisalsi AJ5]EMA36093.1 hypothetical protein C445_04528 [Halobiforma lacisalsi AJ5]